MQIPIITTQTKILRDYLIESGIYDYTEDDLEGLSNNELIKIVDHIKKTEDLVLKQTKTLIKLADLT